mgnify:CR=1 FL=1
MCTWNEAPLVSITLAPLPSWIPCVVAEHSAGLVIVAQPGLPTGELEAHLQRTLPYPALTALAAALGVSLDDLDGTRWWHPDAPTTWAAIRRLEAAGRLTPWPHHQ